MASRIHRWPWIAQQRWEDVLFIHWPVPYEKLQPNIPDAFKLETFDGQAWVSVVHFQALHSRLRGMPRFISHPSFLQSNVRTYVTFQEEPGVYFFSLDANSKLVVEGLKLLSLPYLRAKMDLKRTKNGMEFNSQRIHKGTLPAHISIRYEPLPDQISPTENTLDAWLTERYCIWTIKGNKIFKGPISHHPWILQKAKSEVKMVDLIPFLQESYFQTANSLVHFSKSKTTYLHPFELKGFTNYLYKQW